MDNYGGDLTDIVRAIGGPIGGESNTTSNAIVGNWQFQPVSDGNYLNSNCDDFGDPFSHIKDPLLDELDIPKSPFFNNSADILKTNSPLVEGTTGIFSPKDRPNNFFSRMLQISPSAKRPIVTNDVISSGANTSKTCFVENSVGLQISSPRNTGIKRRKSQAKKVVCIPAPAPVNSRPSGEVVPSDLWAWRKYGQKPIKGSPFPRGYYRCSSSKGCSARKQVERSRTDPNMLVITYTSEHNHPWPTQRNALAGSTRSQPSKSLSSPKTPTQAPKDEPKDEPTTISSPPLIIPDGPTIKEEMEVYDNDIDNDINIRMKMTDDDIDASYRPLLPTDIMGNDNSDDFFAELGEIGDDDPLHLLFSTSPGFPDDHDQERESNKALDAFTSFFDWTGNSNTNNINNNNNSSFGDAKRGL